MGKRLCQICGENEAEFEGVICMRCKTGIDQKDFGEELRCYEEESLSWNHRGETCWLDGTICRGLGWCGECEVYRSWKVKQDED